MSGKFKTRLFTTDTVSYFEGFLLKEIWEVIYQGHDINEIFNNFLRIYFHTFEASFPVIYHDKHKDITQITKGIRIPCQQESSLYLLRNCSDLKLKICYKHYCCVLRKIVREAKKLYYNELITNSENKVTVTWKVIKNLTGKIQNSQQVSYLQRRWRRAVP